MKKEIVKKAITTVKKAVKKSPAVQPTKKAQVKASLSPYSPKVVGMDGKLYATVAKNGKMERPSPKAAFSQTLAGAKKSAKYKADALNQQHRDKKLRGYLVSDQYDLSALKGKN
jgi:hypothetical protein